MPAKRKSKSKMIHTIPLPAFKAKQPIVMCFICKGKFNKLEVNQTKEIAFKYLCDNCKKSYSGKLKFREKNNHEYN